MKHLWQRLQHWVFWGMTWQALHIRIWGFSAVLQIFSSSVKLDRDLGLTDIFMSIQRCSIGFKSGLWLDTQGHSQSCPRTHSCIVLAVCIGSLFFWEMNLPEILSALDQVFIKNISVLLCSAFPQPWPAHRPCHWKTPPKHDAATTMFHCGDGTGQVMSGAWSPPFFWNSLKSKSSQCCC